MFWADQSQSLTFTSRHVDVTCSQRFLEVHVKLCRSVPVGLCGDGVANASHWRRSINQALESEDMSPCKFHSGGNCRTETVPLVLIVHLETSASRSPPQVDTSWNIRRSSDSRQLFLWLDNQATTCSAMKCCWRSCLSQLSCCGSRMSYFFHLFLTHSLCHNLLAVSVKEHELFRKLKKCQCLVERDITAQLCEYQNIFSNQL